MADSYEGWKWQAIWRKVEWPILYNILSKCKERIGESASILDVGVGTGEYLHHITSKSCFRTISGIDISKGMLTVARRRLGDKVNLQLGDARKLEFADQSFDVVLLCRVASHMAEIEGAIREIYRVLRRGGLLVVSDIDPRHPYENTRIPLGQSKITVETHKHSVAKWIASGNQVGLRVNAEVIITSRHVFHAIVSEVPSTILKNVDHPVSFVLGMEKTE